MMFFCQLSFISSVIRPATHFLTEIMKLGFFSVHPILCGWERLMELELCLLRGNRGLSDAQPARALRPGCRDLRRREAGFPIRSGGLIFFCREFVQTFIKLTLNILYI